MSGPYDRFRENHVVPIGVWRQPVVAFGGRALEKISEILVSAETPLPRARRLDVAAAARPRAGPASAVAVEGYVDVIAMVITDTKDAMAPLGTALTAEQLALMSGSTTS